MAYPQPIVEIAFDDGPYVLNPTWTDVTSYVWRMDIDRGRTDDWGDFNSFASVTLNNRTRRFDPYYTSGPYYGKLLPRRQIRIRATYGGTTYDVFRGFIDGWNPEWTDAGTNSSVTVSCFDALQLLGSEQLPADWSRDYILSQSPRHYYPCDEPIVGFTAGTVLNDYGSIPLPITTTTYASNANQLASGLPGNSVQASESSAGSSAFGAVATSTNFSVSMWAVMDSSTGVTGGSVGAYGWSIGFEPTTAKYVVYIDDQGAGLRRTYTSVQTYDGAVPSFIAFTFNITSKALQLYVDGVAAATTAATAGAIIVIIGESVSIGLGQFQQICVWTGLIAQATLQNIFNYSKANFPETTTARFNRIIGETQFPNVPPNTTPSASSLVLLPASPANSVLDITDNAPQVSDELRLVATSEGGPLFVSKNGTITMFSQTEQFTATRSVTTQAVYGGIGQKLGQQVMITADGDSMRNSVYVTMSGGGVYQQNNASSVTAYGTASMSLDTQVQTLANAQSLAQMTTGFGGNIYPDLSPVDVVLSADENWAPTLGLELMDRIEVNVAPPTGNVITTPMLVQKIRHEVVPGLWRTQIDGSARWAAVFILDQSLLDGTDLLV